MLLALALVGLGVLLVVLVAGYYLYGWRATRGLDSLVYATRDEPHTGVVSSAMTLASLRDSASSSTPLKASPSALGVLPDPAAIRLYPGEWMAFNSWAEPSAAQPVLALGEEAIEGFLPLGNIVLGSKGTLPAATYVRIPAIEVAAEVQPLRILGLGDSRQYQTPNNVVGHIPETANPGEAGNVWLFGHLQSPINGEGSLFRDLPRIPEILRTGQRVYVVLEAPAISYLYEVYKTDVLPQNDLHLYDADQAELTLVTCVPAFTYDHRLLVTARLVGFKSLT